MQAVEARLPAATAEGQGPKVMAGLLQAVAQFVARTAPEESDSVMTALAEAATRLPSRHAGTHRRRAAGAGSRPGLWRASSRALVRRVSDGSIASLIAREVRGGRGTSPRLADAFCGLAPDPHRRSAILTSPGTRSSRPGATAPIPRSPRRGSSPRRCCSPTRTRPSSRTPTTRNSRGWSTGPSTSRRTTPTRRTWSAAWRDSVDDDQLRLLDAELIADLMQLQQDVDAVARIWPGSRSNRVNVAARGRRLPGGRAAGRGDAVAGREPSPTRRSGRRRRRRCATSSRRRRCVMSRRTSTRRTARWSTPPSGSAPPSARWRSGPLAEVLSPRGAEPAAQAPHRHPDRLRRGGPPVGRAPAPVAQRRRPPDGRAAAAGVRRPGSAARAGVAARRHRTARAARSDDGHRHARHRAGLRRRSSARSNAAPSAPARRSSASSATLPDDDARTGAVAPGPQGALSRRDVGSPRAGHRAARRGRAAGSPSTRCRRCCSAAASGRRSGWRACTGWPSTRSRGSARRTPSRSSKPRPRTARARAARPPGRGSRPARARPGKDDRR